MGRHLNDQYYGGNRLREVGAPVDGTDAANKTYVDNAVPEWAKAETKPSYSYSEISGTPTIDTELSETSTNAVQNKAINVLSRKLWDKVDVVSRLGAEYETHEQYIASTTGNWASSSSYKHWIIPVDGIRVVTIETNASTASYHTFLKTYTDGETGTPDYATGYTTTNAVSANTTKDIVVPPDAKYMYLNTGQITSGNPDGAAKPMHVFLTGAGITEHTGDGNGFVKDDGSIDHNTYLTDNDVAPVATSGSYNDLTNKPTIPEDDILQYYMWVNLSPMADGTHTGIIEQQPNILAAIDTARDAGKMVLLSIVFGTEPAAVLFMPSQQFNPEYSFNGSLQHNGRIYFISVFPKKDQNGQYVYDNTGAVQTLQWNVEVASMSMTQPSGGNSSVIPSGTCDAGNTATAKTVTISGITALADGLTILVKNNSVASTSGVTLNLNGLGAKPIYCNTAGSMSAVTTQWGASQAYVFVYSTLNTSGGRWDMQSRDTNTIPAAYCSTAAGTQAKTASHSSYMLREKTYVYVTLAYTNSYSGKITLNINSKGAKDVWINGAVSSGSNNTLPSGTYLVYYDDDKYYFRTDGKLTVKGIAFGGSYNDLTDKPVMICNYDATNYTMDKNASDIVDAVAEGIAVLCFAGNRLMICDHATNGNIHFHNISGNTVHYITYSNNAWSHGSYILPTTLAGLGDTTITTSPQDGETLIYDNRNSIWKNGNVTYIDYFVAYEQSQLDNTYVIRTEASVLDIGNKNISGIPVRILFKYKTDEKTCYLYPYRSSSNVIDFYGFLITTNSVYLLRLHGSYSQGTGSSWSLYSHIVNFDQIYPV